MDILLKKGMVAYKKHVKKKAARWSLESSSPDSGSVVVRPPKCSARSGFAATHQPARVLASAIDPRARAGASRPGQPTFDVLRDVATAGPIRA